jgi:hypothetical protein
LEQAIRSSRERKLLKRGPLAPQAELLTYATHASPPHGRMYQACAPPLPMSRHFRPDLGAQRHPGLATTSGPLVPEWRGALRLEEPAHLARSGSLTARTPVDPVRPTSSLPSGLTRPPCRVSSALECTHGLSIPSVSVWAVRVPGGTGRLSLHPWPRLGTALPRWPLASVSCSADRVRCQQGGMTDGDAELR